MKPTSLFLFALLVASGCKRTAESPKSAPPTNVQVVHAHRGAIARNAVFPANVLAYQTATLYAKIPGYLKAIAVDKGDAVQAGDFIAELEAPELVAELGKYQADVEVAEINLKRINEARQKAADLVVPLA